MTRRWGPAATVTPPIPLVLVSSRDGHPVPHVAGAARLARLAEAHGWVVEQTYALALVPERRYDNGNVAKAAHRRASVVVRLRRGTARGYGMWDHEGGGEGPGWRYSAGLVFAPGRVARLGAKAILDAVQQGEGS